MYTPENPRLLYENGFGGVYKLHSGVLSFYHWPFKGGDFDGVLSLCQNTQSFLVFYD